MKPILITDLAFIRALARRATGARRAILRAVIADMRASIKSEARRHA